MNLEMGFFLKERTHKLIDRQTAQIGGWMDRQINGQIDKWTDKVDGWMNGWTDRYQQIDQVGRQMDGQILIDSEIQICKHTYICEWVDGYINGYTHPIYSHSHLGDGWRQRLWQAD